MIATQSTTPAMDRLSQNLFNLQSALAAQDPLIAGHLSEIHKLLIGQEELVHLLSEEQVAVIIQGQMKQANIDLAAVTKPKSKTALTKRVTGLSLDDI